MLIFAISFQPNPLTQKDWNYFFGWLLTRSLRLPTKSIDPEGLKLDCHFEKAIMYEASNQIHWPRRIETDPAAKNHDQNNPSNQIHWPRRIETSLFITWQKQTWSFQPNPLTQKDWNGNPIVAKSPVAGLPTKSIDPEGLKHTEKGSRGNLLKSSNQIHWPRRIETKLFNHPNTSKNVRFQPNPLTQKDWNIFSSRVLPFLKFDFQPNPLTQKDWNGSSA